MSKYSLDLFLHACGAPGPLSLTVECGGAAERHVLHQPFAVVGRDPRADLRPAGRLLTRRHAFLQVLAGRVLSVDLAGPPAGGRPAAPRHGWLAPGQKLKLGAVKVRLAADFAAAAEAGHAPGREAPPLVTLDVAGGVLGAARCRVKYRLALVGHAPECQIRLRDASVSRFHCALVNTPAGLWAVDLLGRGGIAVNGVVVKAVRLDGGDELRVGSFTIRPRPGDLTGGGWLLAAAAPPPAELPAAPAGVDLLPPPAASGPEAWLATPGPDESPGVPVPPYVYLFAQLQQQMVEQFRLTMSGVVAAFREMHRDQMAMVWREMALVQQLTEELTDLKAELNRLTAAPAAPDPRALPPPAAVPLQLLAYHVALLRGCDVDKPRNLAKSVTVE